MKKSMILLLIAAAIPATTLLAGSNCSTCNKGSKRVNSYNRQHQYQQNITYDAKRHQNRTDYFVSDSDERIAEEIRGIVQTSNVDNPNDIQVFVEYGKVILEGKVRNPSDRQALEDAAANVQGVRNVVNGIYVDNRQPRTKDRNGGQNGNGGYNNQNTHGSHY